ncbi:MAG: DUF3298 domain-containing protein [Firmicutes bacterium]|nr:DUF3298 domain-containing protein [Bacillota bacterium]
MSLIKLPVCINTQLYIEPNIKMYYPLVYGLCDYTIQQKINGQIYKKMFHLFNEVRHLNLPTNIEGSYEIKTNERNVLSLSLTALGDFKGAHPKTVIKSLNFDVNTGKNYPLSDLFKPRSDYIERISNIIKKEIKEREIPLIEDFKSIGANQDYYIADKNLVIYFQQYEISPYYVGFPYFSIPIYYLEDIIKENSILERMIRFF